MAKVTLKIKSKPGSKGTMVKKTTVTKKKV